MSMHLEKPWFSTARKSKKKYRNSANAKEHRELAASWEELQKKWSPTTPSKRAKPTPLSYQLTAPAGRGNTNHIPSRDTGIVQCVKAPPKVYTGNAMIGIGQLHKSNCVPIFRKEDAEDLARMRR